MSGADNWGRVRSDPVSADGGRAARRGTFWAVLRGIVFVPGALVALALTYVLGHSGLPAVFIFVNLCLVPFAVVCWIQASAGKGGDRWTFGYLVALALDYTLVATVMAMVR